MKGEAKRINRPHPSMNPVYAMQDARTDSTEVHLQNKLAMSPKRKSKAIGAETARAIQASVASDFL